MEVLEQLRHEAERRASTPEGLLALADLLLQDFNEILNAKPHPQSCFITFENLVEFFSWIQTQGRNVYIEFCESDFNALFDSQIGKIRHTADIAEGKVVLFGAVMACDRVGMQIPGEVRAVDYAGIYSYRQWWPNPKARLRDLLKVYVLAKRQLEYTIKRYKAPDIDYQRIHALKQTIDHQRAMVEKLALTVPPAQMEQWKKEIGSTLRYGSMGFELHLI